MVVAILIIVSCYYIILKIIKHYNFVARLELQKFLKIFNWIPISWKEFVIIIEGILNDSWYFALTLDIALKMKHWSEKILIGEKCNTIFII